MADHFLDQVIARRKVGGEARAIMATDGIERAIDYWRAINAALAKRGSPYKAIIAFSGTVDDAGEQRTEAWFNGFPSSELEDKFDADPYRFLVVADKYLTGFDQPKLFAMYVDKTLAGVKAVQALSRLNRARPGKTEPFVLDFRNDPAVIAAAFSDFYRTTILSGETDPNKLHDLKRGLDVAGVYAESDIESIVSLFPTSAPRDRIDPILDARSVQYEDLPEDDQIAFKGAAKAFVRTYAFLGAILRYAVPEWEKLSTFLTLLIPKLPSPTSDETPVDVLETIDMDSYRVEVEAALEIALTDADAEIEPVPMGAAGARPEPEIDQLSSASSAISTRGSAQLSFAIRDRVTASRSCRKGSVRTVECRTRCATATPRTRASSMTERSTMSCLAVSPITPICMRSTTPTGRSRHGFRNVSSNLRERKAWKNREQAEVIQLS